MLKHGVKRILSKIEVLEDWIAGKLDSIPVGRLVGIMIVIKLSHYSIIPLFHYSIF